MAHCEPLMYKLFQQFEAILICSPLLRQENPTVLKLQWNPQPDVDIVWRKLPQSAWVEPNARPVNAT